MDLHSQPLKGHIFKFKVDKMMLETESEYLTGSEILKAAGYNATEYFLKQFINGQPVNIKPEQTVWIGDPGLERFVTIPKEASDGSISPKTFKYKVDKTLLETESEFLTGEEILQAAGYNAKDYFLKQIIKGQPINIALDQSVHISNPGLERFVTIPKEATDGDGNFELFEEDVENLKKGGFQWETLSLNGNWLIIKGFPVPDGYNCQNVEVAINIPSNYPQGKLDMAYFYPALKRLDEIPIPATEVTVNINGKSYQRWSRHRNSIAWRAGIDSITTHIEEIKNWLQNEFIKRPRKYEAA